MLYSFINYLLSLYYVHVIAKCEHCGGKQADIVVAFIGLTF